MQQLFIYLSISVNLCCLMFLGLLFIIYYRKRSVNNAENYIYRKMLNGNLIFLFVELALFFSSVLLKDNITLILLIEKLYLFLTLNCILTFIYYIYVVANFKDDNDENLKNSTSNFMKMRFLSLLIIITMFLLPIKHKMVDGYILYSYGPSPIFMAICSVFAIIFGLFNVYVNRKTIDKRKILPLYVFIFLMSIFLTIHYFNQSLFLTSLSMTLISYLMYFTIENPDMKLLEEVHKAKEISDNANEEKTLFLYNMTQEIRDITNEINNSADMILESKEWEEAYDDARNIKAITSKFTSMTNEILDVSKIDSASIKVYNTKYNIKNIIKQVVNIYSDICKSKELSFRTNIDHDIPDVLYGDSISLKEVLTVVLNNSCEYTDSGYVEFDINTIIKNDICRLIITIEDSGIGIKSEDINKIKIDNKSLSKANKLVTLMNGAMMISSNYGIGTKVKIIIDQKIEINENKEVAKYDREFKNINILMVDDNESGIKIIQKLIKGTDINLDSVMNGKECLNMIRVNKYDLILLDEELSQIKGSELLQKIKEIRNFKTPVILLTKDNSYEYNNEYILFGFSDYLLKPVKKEELLNKIDKYTKKDNE